MIPIPPKADIDIRRAFNNVEERLRRIEAIPKPVEKSITAPKRSADQEVDGDLYVDGSLDVGEDTALNGEVSAPHLYDGLIKLIPTGTAGTSIAQRVFNISASIAIVPGGLSADSVLSRESRTQNAYIRDHLARPMGGHYAVLEEDFVSGHSSTAALIGQLGWTIYGSAGSWSASTVAEAGHFGIEYLDTATMAASNILSLYHFTTAYTIPMDPGILEWQWYVKLILDSTACNRTPIFFVVTSDVTFGGGGAGNLCRAATAHLGFHYNPSLSNTNWYVSGSDGSSRTQTDTGITATNDTWVNLKMKQNINGIWSYYIDGALIGSYSSEVPVTGTAMQIIPAMESNATTDQRISMDYVNLIMERGV